MLDTLKMNTKWDTSGKQIPETEGMIDIFKSNKATKEQVKEHVNLVWSDSTFGAQTPKYFSKFDIIPTDTVKLEDVGT